MRDPKGDKEVFDYYYNRAKEMNLNFISLEEFFESVYFAVFIDDKDEKTYYSIYIEPSLRGNGIYCIAYNLLKRILRCSPVIATVKDCNIESFLKSKGIPYALRG